MWGSAADTDLNRLVVLQKKAIRILSGEQHFQVYGEPGALPSSEPLFKNLGLLKLNDIFNLSVVNFVYETLVFDSPPNFWNWFQYTCDVHEHSTKSSSVVNRDHYFDTGEASSTFTLYVNKINLVKYGGRMIKIAGAHIWNKLTPCIHESASLSIFKEKTKSFYIGQYQQQ